MTTLFSTIETELADSIWDDEILDPIFGTNEDDLLRGSKDNDLLDGGEGDDELRGGKGNDLLIGGQGNDLLRGGKENDTLEGGMGSDELRGGQGNDLLISRSDAGEPEIGQETDATKVYPNQDITETDDTLVGGGGADTFRFEILLNATVDIMKKHADDNGKINWKGVAGENDNVHDHWVEPIGNDVIYDFDREEDKIEIRGHTVTVDKIEYDKDEKYSIISLSSNQANGGAHDDDQLGTIRVYGDLITIDDLKVEGMTHDAVYKKINSLIGGEGNDTLKGGKHVDILDGGMGSDSLEGGKGSDLLISRSDAGKPDATNTETDDILFGGEGADTFRFEILLNATVDIMKKHANNDGIINWEEVAGENGNVHDHWVEGIGNDVILDFDRDAGDKIEIGGHTVTVKEITTATDSNGDYSIISLYSNQGGAGAHHGDQLGTISVYGDLITESDLQVNSDKYYAVYQKISEFV